jgi:hypothetical protein
VRSHPLDAFLAAEEALRQPLSQKARLHAEEEWRRAYFDLLKGFHAGNYSCIYHGHTVIRTEEMILIKPIIVDSRRTA